jgi:hypothetical protein
MSFAGSRKTVVSKWIGERLPMNLSIGSPLVLSGFNGYCERVVGNIRVGPAKRG